MARDPQRVRRAWCDLEQSRDSVWIGDEHSGLGEEGLDKGADVRTQGGATKHRHRLSGATKEYLDAWRALGGSRSEGSCAHLLQSREHAFDMLAGPKTIHAVVDAAAGIVPVGEITNLDLIKAPSPRVHAECTIRPKLWLQRYDLCDLAA